jgi:hypothetical protein
MQFGEKKTWRTGICYLTKISAVTGLMSETKFHTHSRILLMSMKRLTTSPAKTEDPHRKNKTKTTLNFTKWHKINIFALIFSND